MNAYQNIDGQSYMHWLGPIPTDINTLHVIIYLFFYNYSVLVQGTVVEGTIQQLFEGHHMNYIECINVDYKSTRKESFYGTSGLENTFTF